VGCLAWQRGFLLGTLVTFTAACRGPARAFALQRPHGGLPALDARGRRHTGTHHGFGHSVGFLLVRLADMKLSLDDTRSQQALQGLVAEGAVKLQIRRNFCPRDRRRVNGRREARATEPLMCQ
jgi:hypothetical protein